MDSLTVKTTGILKLFKGTPYKIPVTLQAFFFKTLSEMLTEGFSINQSLQFMKLLLPKQHSALQLVIDNLSRGQNFELSLEDLGFSAQITAQIFFAQRQGRFAETLLEISDHLALLADYRKQLAKALIYPILLSSFLIALLFGMRSFMLPQIMTFISEETFQENVTARLLIIFFTFLPQITLFLVGGFLVVYLLVDFYLMRLSELKRFQLLVKVPFLKKIVRQYCSYRLAKELGYFFNSGFSIQQTIELWITYPIDPFFTELAQALKNNFLQGTALQETIEDLDIFTSVLPVVIYQGELTNQTAHKCRLYASKTFADLLESINKKITYIQPLLFILIALLVMAMYLVMMLPMLTMEI